MEPCCTYPILEPRTKKCFSCGNKFFDPTKVISSLLSFPEKIDKYSYLNTYGVWEVQGLWEFDEPLRYLGNLDVIAKLLAPKSYQGLCFKKVGTKEVDFIVPYEFSTEIPTTGTNESVSILLYFDLDKPGMSSFDPVDYMKQALSHRPGVSMGTGEFPETFLLKFNKIKK